jgi:transposase-like protein
MVKGLVVVGAVEAVGRWREVVRGPAFHNSTAARAGSEEDQMSEIPEDVKRWTAKRRSALVLSVLRGETSAQEAARAHGLTVAEIEGWKVKFLTAAENALRSRPKDEEGLKDKRIRQLERKIGEMVLDMDIMREALKLHPFDDGTSDD